MTTQRFRTTVESGERGRIFITIPFDPKAVWGARSRFYVKGTINGHPFHASLGARGGTYFIPLNKQLQRIAAIAPGSTVSMVMEPSEAQEEDVPAEFEQALFEAPEARSFFDVLTPFQRTQYTKWILEAKRADTRASRVAEVIALLRAGKKQRTP